MSKEEPLSTIQKTVRQSFIRAAIIPFLFVEITFLLIYWLSVTISNDQSIQIATESAYDTIQIQTSKAAKRIEHQLATVSTLTSVFSEQASVVFNQEMPSSPLPNNLTLSSSGTYYSTFDNGGSSVFYSGIKPIGQQQRDKVAKTAHLDPLMKSIKHSNSLIRQVYFNTFDSYNRMYPYVDVASQFPEKMDIPSFNFYYQADLAHNPEKQTVWTKAYLDPAGSGWMISSIAPVYSTSIEDKLEAVVGLDVTLASIINEILKIKIGWVGYALIIDSDGSIIAMPKRAEADFAIKELTTHDYQQSIKQNNFKPEHFNLKKHPNINSHIDDILSSPQGATNVTLRHDMLMSWSSVSGTNWKLIFFASTKQIERRYFTVKQNLANIGWLMVAGLFLFYLAFFIYISHRSKRIGITSIEELNVISDLVQSIGRGNYHQQKPKMKFIELDHLADHIVKMGEKLGEAYHAVAKAEYRAGHDKLTGLPNRYLMEEYLIQSISIAKRHKHQLAVLFIDLDKFKQINDELGHYVGDIVLRSVAFRVQDNLRESDTVARFGGDEFIVILNDIDSSMAVEQLITTLKSAIAQPINSKLGQCQVGASIGYAVYPTHAQNSQDLVTYADGEMYKQKPAKNHFSAG